MHLETRGWGDTLQNTCKTHRLDQSPVLKQRRFILYIVTRDPGLDLVSQSLELLNLCFEVQFRFLFLSLVG